MLVLAACGSDDSANSDSAMDDDVDMSDEEMSGDEHGGHESTSEVDWEPVPSISVEETIGADGAPDASVTMTDFTLDESAVDGDPENGIGHLHLYVDGEKIGRRFSDTVDLQGLSEGSHEIRLVLSANDHSLLTFEDNELAAAMTVEVSADQAATLAAAMGDSDAMDDDGDGHGDDHGSGTGTETDAEADVTFAVAIADGERIAGESDSSASLGEVVAISVSSDVADDVHVHGYDIIKSVEAGGSTTVTFEANIPGKFEVEMESSGFLVTELTVS